MPQPVLPVLAAPGQGASPAPSPLPLHPHQMPALEANGHPFRQSHCLLVTIHAATHADARIQV